MNIDSYKITEEYPGLTDAPGDCGDFVYFKQFKVENATRPGANLSGIIIQAVKKDSKVADANGNVYDTTDAILNFTNGYVNYSCDSYLEAFEIDANGKSTDGDAFQNGALARYDKRGRAFIYKPTDRQYQTYKTQGQILMYGRSFFIPATHPLFHHVRFELGWNYSKATPANGLPFKEYSDELYNNLASCSQSNFLDHNVQVFWHFDQQLSQVQSKFECFPNPNPQIVNTCLILKLPGHLGHGGRKRKTKTKKNNKRKRRKTPRRH